MEKKQLNRIWWRNLAHEQKIGAEMRIPQLPSLYIKRVSRKSTKWNERIIKTHNEYQWIIYIYIAIFVNADESAFK